MASLLSTLFFRIFNFIYSKFVLRARRLLDVPGRADQRKSKGTPGMRSTMSSTEMFPPLPLNSKLPGIPEACLYSGAKFKGERRWNKSRNNTEIHIQNVDRENEVLYGELRVCGPASDLPTKITYFEGEIISNKHSFLTRKWNADSETDKQHWWRFDCLPLLDEMTNGILDSDAFDYGVMQLNDQIYMRWKERQCRENVGFVAPGFYYVCLRKTEGVIEGIYYERNCDAWNEDTFRVKYIPEKSLPVFEFR